MSNAPQKLWRYALLGVPLGFLGLPLYMHLPHYYAQSFGMSLSLLGGIFLFSRLVDCALDPWIGRALDGASAQLKRIMIAAGVMVAAGMLLLFTLPLWLGHTPSAWLVGLLLILTYLAYSVLSIRFYASGVGLAHNAYEAARVSSWREGMLVIGIILAAAAPGLGLGYAWVAALFALLLGGALWLGRATFIGAASAPPEQVRVKDVLRTHARLYIVLFFNALAPAITATLYLFYMDEVLGAANLSAFYLLAYFAAAIIAMLIWVRLASRFNPIRCLRVAMVLAIFGFIGASQLGAGDAPLFLVICLVTGVAFGADAALLPSLLSNALGRTHTPEHAAFGIWMAISKLTLALAAGFALTAIDGLQTMQIARVDAIRFTYGLLPCVIKAIALLCLIHYHSYEQRSLS